MTLGDMCASIIDSDCQFRQIKRRNLELPTEAYGVRKSGDAVQLESDVAADKDKSY